MAWSSRDSGAEGYATPGALVLSLAFAMIGAGMVANSVRLLQLSKAELERSRFEHAMDGTHLAAAAAVVRSGRSAAFSWTLGSDLGPMLVIAEPEADKLGLESAAALGEEMFEALGVAESAPLRAELTRQSQAATPANVADLDTAPRWRDCAPSVISPFGRADRAVYAERLAPDAGSLPPAWHIGETWRIRVATTAGWRDDRIVRFTGNARHPAAIVSRRLSRGGVRGGECEEILRGLFGA